MRTRLRRPPRLLAKTRPEGGTLLTPSLDRTTQNPPASLKLAIKHANRSDWLITAAVGLTILSRLAFLFPILINYANLRYLGRLLFDFDVLTFLALAVASLVSADRNRHLMSLAPLPDFDSPYPRSGKIKPYVIPQPVKVAASLAVAWYSLAAFVFVRQEVWPLQAALGILSILVAVSSLIRGKSK